MEKQIIIKLHKDFEDCAHEKDGVEFWYARELQKLLGYDKWSNFEGVIEKAKFACKNAKQEVSDHFADVGKMITAGKSAILDAKKPVGFALLRGVTGINTESITYL